MSLGRSLGSSAVLPGSVGQWLGVLCTGKHSLVTSGRIQKAPHLHHSTDLADVADTSSVRQPRLGGANNVQINTSGSMQKGFTKLSDKAHRLGSTKHASSR